MNTINVRNMTSARGNKIANQFEITTDQGIYFQSYTTLIAFKSNEDGKVYLNKDYWDYSNTTGKYRNIFLNETKRETQKKIDSGEYVLVEDM